MPKLAEERLVRVRTGVLLLLLASGTRTFLLRGVGEIAVSYDGSPVGPSAWFGGVGVPGIRLSNRLLLQGLDRAAVQHS